MSNMYIRSQDREKLYRLGGNYACVEYGSVTKRAKKGQEPKETHRIFACVALSLAAGFAYWYVAPGLSCEMPAAAEQ